MSALHDDVHLAFKYAEKARKVLSTRGISYLLSFEEYKLLNSIDRCQLTGVELVHHKGHEGGKMPDNAFTIDRLDAKGPYSIRNCMVMCHSANHAKANLDVFLKDERLTNEQKLSLLYKMENILRREIRAEEKKKEAQEAAFKERYGFVPKSK